MKTLEKMLEELSGLKRQRAAIDYEIADLEKQIASLKNNAKYKEIKTNKENRELFAYFMMETRGLSDSSIKSYYSSLDRMKNLLSSYLSIEVPVDFYFIDDIPLFEDLIDAFERSADLWSINLKNHHCISAAYNNYLKFLKQMEEIKRG